MAATPQFAATPVIGIGVVSAAVAQRDGTGALITVLTAGVAGTRIDEIVVQSTGDPADSVVTLFLHDGANARLFDEFDLGNPAAASSTTPGYRQNRIYDTLTLPAGWSLRAAVTVAVTSGALNVIALGGNL